MTLRTAPVPSRPVIDNVKAASFTARTVTKLISRCRAYANIVACEVDGSEDNQAERYLVMARLKRKIEMVYNTITEVQDACCNLATFTADTVSSILRNARDHLRKIANARQAEHTAHWKNIPTKDSKNTAAEGYYM